ncbi:MAG: helix-turn-helix transcriptional regulator [Candidatus Dormibacteria bacterium]
MLLTAIKRRGRARAEELALDLSITGAAVRQQVARLESDGLVTHRDEVLGRGRPSRYYEISAAAESLFPKRYGDLTNELLSYVGGSEGPSVDDLFEKRGRRRMEDARSRLEGLDLDARVAELARILDEDGYLAEMEELAPGTWRITEHNCAILTVAHGFSQACSTELEFIREALPGAEVERVSHMMDGAYACAYLVTAGS